VRSNVIITEPLGDEMGVESDKDKDQRRAASKVVRIQSGGGCREVYAQNTAAMINNVPQLGGRGFCVIVIAVLDDTSIVTWG